MLRSQLRRYSCHMNSYGPQAVPVSVPPNTTAQIDPLPTVSRASRLPCPGGKCGLDLSAVEALAARAGIVVPERTVVVVGTNGKTSTATFLARLLQAAGLHVGLTVSPHLRRWSERVAGRRGRR